VLALGACAPSPVAWTTDPQPLPGTEGAVTTLAIRGAPDRSVVLAAPVPAPAHGLPVLGTGACINSVRWARADAQQIAVAWWVARPDSSAVLRLARSRDDGAHWDAEPPAEERDRGVRGCARPAPAVALDPRSGYTHLAYYIEPGDGAGVFYAHLMDLPAAGTGRASVSMFHAPVAIVYGEGAAEASVAGHGDTVVVAYQNPNGLVPHVDLALSMTSGHTFLYRISVSGSGGAASTPIVAVDGATVAVGWRERSAPPGTAAADTTSLAHDLVRIGVIQ
jgi:hypothetical protein